MCDLNGDRDDRNRIPVAATCIHVQDYFESIGTDTFSLMHTLAVHCWQNYRIAAAQE